MPRLAEPPPRIPHDEPGFADDYYTTEYSRQTGKHSGADFDQLIRFISPHLRKSGTARVLDIGSGPGWTGIRLAQHDRGVHVTGIDLSDSFLAVANKNKTDCGVADRVDFQYGDATTLVQFDDASFDFVISNQSLHYWDPPQLVFNQVARVLKPGAVFCIADDRRDLSWLAKFSVGIGLVVHSRQIGRSWQRSLAGCFTPREVETMLQDSDLRDCWQIEAGGRMMLITGQVMARCPVEAESP